MSFGEGSSRGGGSFYMNHSVINDHESSSSDILLATNRDPHSTSRDGQLRKKPSFLLAEIDVYDYKR